MLTLFFIIIISFFIVALIVMNHVSFFTFKSFFIAINSLVKSIVKINKRVIHISLILIFTGTTTAYAMDHSANQDLLDFFVRGHILRGEILSDTAENIEDLDTLRAWYFTLHNVVFEPTMPGNDPFANNADSHLGGVPRSESWSLKIMVTKLLIFLFAAAFGLWWLKYDFIVTLPLLYYRTKIQDYLEIMIQDPDKYFDALEVEYQRCVDVKIIVDDDL